MFYQIDNFNKRISNAHFSFDTNTSLNKNERFFLNYILKHFLKTDDLKVQVPTLDLLEVLKLEINEIQLFLERISKKTLLYNFHDSNDSITGSFNLINSYLISENNIYINLPKELKSSKAIRTLYSFSYKPTYKFYCFFIKNFILKQSFKVNLEEFKLILKSDNKYERFFDFEKNILKPIIKDLELSYKIKYEKIKIGNNLNNKVIAAEFLFESDSLDVTEDIKLKSILFMIKNDVQDVAEVYSILKEGIQINGYETTYKTCFKVKQLYKKSQLSFDEVLKASFKKLNLKDSEPSIFIKKVFSSPKELKKCFIYELEKIKPGVILDTSFFSEKFLQDLFLLNDDKTLYFKNSDVSIFINWENNKDSIIKIYLL